MREEPQESVWVGSRGQRATKDMGKMLGGDEEKDPDAAKKEEERQEALRQEEEERKAKYAKMEAEREAMRQGIRDKVGTGREDSWAPDGAPPPHPPGLGLLLPLKCACDGRFFVALEYYRSSLLISTWFLPDTGCGAGPCHPHGQCGGWAPPVGAWISCGWTLVSAARGASNRLLPRSHWSPALGPLPLQSS
uniref:Complexin-1 n=1 Tax=Ursus maritimus TaxID=29073 RepID=A0A452THH6_URSMA